MSVEENKVLARRYYAELMSGGDLTFVDRYFALEFEFTNPTHTEPYKGQEFKDLVTMLRGAFPDLKFTVEHLLAEGDTVVGHWTARGSHTGGPLETLKGDIPAKGNRFEIDGVSWLRFADGKFVEARINEETLGLLRQIGAFPSPTPLAQATSPEQNAAVVDRYFQEVWSAGKLDVLDEILAETCVHRIPTLGKVIQGREAQKQFAQEMRDAMPDLTYRVERQIAEAEKVASRWYLEGTHTNTFMGCAPTGNKVTDQGVDIFIFVDGKIREIWTNEDSLGLLRQLGAFGGG
jgi:steroid delta-isomerase-like uncharacterized protein